MLTPISIFKKPKSKVEELIDKHPKVPSAIINFIGPNQAPARVSNAESKLPIQTSNFMITMNTNLGYKRFSPETRVTLAEHVHDSMTEFGELVKSGELLKCATVRGKMYDCADVDVERYDFTLEIGTKKGHVHSHAILILGGIAHIDIEKANTFIREAFAEYHESGAQAHIQIKSFPNPEAIISAYLQKAQNTLTPAEFADVED